MATIVDKLNKVLDTKLAIKEAIENKGQVVADVPFDQYPDRINAIAGGGSRPVNGPFVRYVDWDGTILADFPSKDFKSSDIPANPVKERSIFQGWTQDLTTGFSSLRSYIIGAQYITDDAKTRIVVDITPNYSDISISILLRMLDDITECIISWGDGSSIIASGVAVTQYIHTYSDYGRYEITIERINGQADYIIDRSTNNHSSFGDAIQTSKIVSCELGKNVLLGQYSFYNSSSLKTLVIPPGMPIIPTSAFSGCKSLTSLIVPNSVSQIDNSAFLNCCSLTSLVISDGVSQIGNYAFQNCYNLTSLVIPNSVLRIDNYAFQNCYNLASLVISDGVSRIGDYAFNYCYSLISLVISDGVSQIGDYAFQNCYSLISLVISDGVSQIGNFAFQNCYNLISLVIPDSVSQIGDYAFYCCKFLASLIIPDGVSQIGRSAFYRCYSLTSLVISNSVSVIDQGAFGFCYSLTSLVIPDSVSQIGDNAFHDCYCLTYIEMKGCKPPSVGSRSFDKIPLNAIFYVPDDALDLYRQSTNWALLAKQIQPLSKKPLSI